MTNSHSGRKVFADLSLKKSQRPQRATREFFLQTHITLLAGDKIAEDFFDPAVASGKLDHSFGKRSAPEVAVESSAHL